MNKLHSSNKVKTSVFENGIQIPQFVLINNGMDLCDMFVLSTLVQLWNDRFGQEEFIFNTKLFNLLFLNIPEEVLDEILNRLEKNNYVEIYGKVSYGGLTWYNIDMEPSFVQYMEGFGSETGVKLPFRSYLMNLDHPGLVSSPPYYSVDVDNTFMNVPDLWSDLLGLLDDHLFEKTIKDSTVN